MKLTWHIIKKDLTRTGYILGIWAFTGLYLLVYRKLNFIGGTAWDNLGIICVFTFIGLSLALIPAIIQEDGLTETNVFWRTKPISPARLLTAKLGLVLSLFALLPFLGFVIRTWFGDGHPSNWDEVWKVGFSLSVIVLSLAAVASATKDMGRHFLCLILCVFAGGVLVTALERYAPDLVPPLRWTVRESKMVAGFALCGLVAAGILYNQYCRRRLAVTITLMALSIVGCGLIATFWTWRFVH